MDYKNRYNVVESCNSEKEVLELIKENLEKQNFKTHCSILVFLSKKGKTISQSTLSRLLSSNGIKKMIMVFMKIRLIKINAIN